MEEEDEQPKATTKTDKTPAPSLIEQANAAAARIEEATREMEAQVQRMEAARVERTLAGRATTTPEKEEETDAEYAERALAGMHDK